MTLFICMSRTISRKENRLVMKKVFCGLLTLLLLLVFVPTTALAVDDSRAYTYELTVDGRDTKEVKTGDVITVVLTLYRTDAEAAYTMYAMQDEIRYDSEFFELVEGSAVLAKDVHTTDIAMRDNFREFYMNYLSFGGGVQWQPKVVVGSFQLKVIGTTGVTRITNQDYLVSLQDGSDSYKCDAKDLTIILSTDCIVRFETNGGSAVADITATYGEKLKRPANPTKEGLYFAGWYKDIDFREMWDFDKDVVSGNMTLYAKWSTTPVALPGDAPADDDPALWPWLVAGAAVLALVLLLVFLLSGKRTVSFDTRGGSEMKPVKVRKNHILKCPKLPVKPGAVFVGWYRDEACTETWRLRSDKVTESMTLYAKWQ